MDIFEDVKRTLRVSHNYIDDEIIDWIEEARQDLILSGVSADKAKDDHDALIKRAIKTYAKGQYHSDIAQAERFKFAYDLLKTHLTMAGDYNGK